MPARRHVLCVASAVSTTAALTLPTACSTTAPRTRTTMNVAQFHAALRFADAPSGQIAYVEQGEGPVALFLHDVPLDGLPGVT
jgi:haloalkane dehalogenase